jgi:hypothetical protein
LYIPNFKQKNKHFPPIVSLFKKNKAGALIFRVIFGVFLGNFRGLDFDFNVLLVRVRIFFATFFKDI